MTSSSLKLCEIGMFQDAFQHFDTDLDGAVNTMEVGMIMRSVGLNPSEADIQVIDCQALLSKYKTFSGYGDGCRQGWHW